MLQNQINLLQAQRQAFNQTALGQLQQMWASQQDATTYLRQHALPYPSVDDGGTRFFNFVMSGIKAYRDGEVMRIDDLRREMISPRPGSIPPTQFLDRQQGAMVLDRLTGTEMNLGAYNNACDQNDWALAQVTSAMNRERASRDLRIREANASGSADWNDVRQRAEQLRRDAENQAREMAANQARLDAQPSPSPTPNQNPGNIRDPHDFAREQGRIQQDAFPIDRANRDNIGRVMEGLQRDHESHAKEAADKANKNIP